MAAWQKYVSNKPQLRSWIEILRLNAVHLIHTLNFTAPGEKRSLSSLSAQKATLAILENHETSHHMINSKTHSLLLRTLSLT